jgi:hypothetical protein
MAWGAIGRWKESDVPSRARILPEEFRSLLAQIHEDARRHGIDLLLLVWPVELNIARNLPPNVQVHTDYQLELLDYGRHKLRFGPERADGLVNLIPIVEEMAKKQPTSAIFLDRSHATSLANERFADAIAKKLIPWVRWRLAEKQGTTGRHP